MTILNVSRPCGHQEWSSIEARIGDIDDRIVVINQVYTKYNRQERVITMCMTQDEIEKLYQGLLIYQKKVKDIEETRKKAREDMRRI